MGRSIGKLIIYSFVTLDVLLSDCVAYQCNGEEKWRSSSANGGP